MAIKAPTSTEAEIQKSGIALLKAMGWKVYRRNVGAMKGNAGQYVRFSEPGMSDTWGITPDGRHFELEFKRPGKRPNTAQLKWLKSMNSDKTPAFWVDNVETLAKVERWLRCFGRTIRYVENSDEYDVVNQGAA